MKITSEVMMAKYVGFWMRFLAAILDSLIVGIPVGLVASLLLMATNLTALYYVVQLIPLVVIIYMEGTMGGGPGKLLLGLKIVNDKGKVIGIPAAILRTLGKWLGSVVFGLGLLWIAFDREKQGWHDKIANTWVVYEK